MSTTAINALENTTILCPLSEFGLIRISGEDSQTFLQGQLSSDVRTISSSNAQYSSHSTAKGRMLASFLIFRDGEDYLLQVSADIHVAIQKRLSMYILRSKVKASDASSELALYGLAGPQAAALLQSTLQVEPKEVQSVLRGDGFIVVSLGNDRFELAIRREQAADIEARLITAGATLADDNTWRLAEIRAGIGWITQANQEEFVAQMANLDLTGAISFTKGCYTGQEIIARTQYLGKLKRRMYRARVAASAVKAGDSVFSPEMNGQASGRIMQAAGLEAGAYEVLVVAQMSSLEHGLHLESADGPQLEILPLPYAID